MYGGETQVRVAHASFRDHLSQRGLSLHPLGSSKSHISPLTASFDYLGYTFNVPKVTVRKSSVEQLLQSLAAKFSDYRHNTEIKLAKFSGLTEQQLRRAFVLELNERITGIVVRNRKYGWIAYFNQINDLTLLHRLDSVVSGLFSRLRDFNYASPPNLKKFRRSYFEMKFRPAGRYVQNYDSIVTVTQMRGFLVERGRIGANEQLSDEGIAFRFDSYHRLSPEFLNDKGTPTMGRVRALWIQILNFLSPIWYFGALWIVVGALLSAILWVNLDKHPTLGSSGTEHAQPSK